MLRRLIYLGLLWRIILSSSYGFIDFEKFQARALQISQEAILAKWDELQKMIGDIADAELDDTTLADLSSLPLNVDLEGAELKIFVSNSMGKELLKQYVIAARKYNGILVFNGLVPDQPGYGKYSNGKTGSWVKLQELVYEITDGEPSAIQIDDESFRKFSIQAVPSFVLVKELGIFEQRLVSSSQYKNEDQLNQIYDKVAGNIGVRRALEIISDEGELAEYANSLLDK